LSIHYTNKESYTENLRCMSHQSSVRAHSVSIATTLSKEPQPYLRVGPSGLTDRINGWACLSHKTIDCCFGSVSIRVADNLAPKQLGPTNRLRIRRVHWSTRNRN